MARFLALALWAFLALPALAQAHDFNVTLPVVSGSFTNSVELVLRVLYRGDGPQAAKAGSCRISVTVEARDATGDNPALVSKSARLGSGELFVFDLPLARFHDSGQVHAALQVTGSGVSRACLLEMTGTRRITEPGLGSGTAGPPQIPVNVPVNVCGNTVAIIGQLTQLSATLVSTISPHSSRGWLPMPWTWRPSRSGSPSVSEHRHGQTMLAADWRAPGSGFGRTFD